jgi:bifunctional UDP-N-acetylglucosamine pyrophosphorylase/glucosamine-1-phosphate N-acetyltransferase
MKSPLAVVVLAAGAGTRMKSALPKVLHPVAGTPMLAHVLANVARLKPAKIVGVIAPGAAALARAFAPHPTAVQKKPLGTGDAVKAALPALRGHAGPVLVVYGDAPLITTASLQRLLATCRREKASVGVLGFVARDPSPYGRLIVKDGALQKIVESRDANAEERAVAFSNSGVTCIAGAEIAGLLGALGNDNVKREFYLTDVVGIARAAGRHAIAVAGEEAEFMGVNSRAELAAAERAMQQRLRARALTAGVSMLDPDTVWLSADTRLGSDVTIGPNVRFGPGVTVARNVRINAFCDIEGARIGTGAIIGPFARIRPGSEVADDVHIGNFVELKATTIRRGAKATTSPISAIRRSAPTATSAPARSS